MQNFFESERRRNIIIRHLTWNRFEYLLLQYWWHLKEPFCPYFQRKGFQLFNLWIHTGCVLASWGQRRCPWQWQSSSWGARCRWRHPGSRSQGTPWERHESPHRWGQRSSKLLPASPNGGWRAWWCPGCCLSTPYGDAWRQIFLGTFRIILVEVMGGINIRASKLNVNIFKDPLLDLARNWSSLVRNWRRPKSKFCLDEGKSA